MPSVDFATLSSAELSALARGVSGLTPEDRSAFAAFLASRPGIGEQLGISSLVADDQPPRAGAGAVAHLPHGDEPGPTRRAPSTDSDLWDLWYFAAKLGFCNNLKKLLREELDEARQALANFAARPQAAQAPFATQRFETSFMAGPEVFSEPGPVVEGRAAVESYIEELEAMLASAGDDGQLANVDLQNALQRRQQALQQETNVSKMTHDVAMAVARNIGQ
jgi:hypothetical protein